MSSVFIFCALPLSVKASGLTTSTTEQQGQIRVRNEDGVMYLTTDTNSSNFASSSSTSTTTSSNLSSFNGFSPLANVSIQLPEGFASDIGGLLNGVLSFIMVIAALLVLFFLISAAFDWITSGGDKGKIDRARQKIMSAIVGLIIIAASFAILNLALQFLGFSSLNDVFNSAGTIEGGAETTQASPTTETELEEIIQATPSASPTSN